MIIFENIKKVYSTYSDSKLCKIYTERQQQNIKKNNEIAREILLNFPCEMLYIPQEFSDCEKLNYLLSIFFNSRNFDAIKGVLDILKKYHYKKASELLKTMQRTDLFFTKDIDFLTYSKLLYGATIVKNIEGASLEKVSIASTKGKIELLSLDKCFNIGTIMPEKRRGFCHNLTSDILTVNKDLYGAYYYIPLEFTGFIEHSVLLDLNHKLVYDFANNIVISLDIWQKFYNRPTILIKGCDFSYLSKRCDEELGLYLTTSTLDNVQRLKRKKLTIK